MKTLVTAAIVLLAIAGLGLPPVLGIVTENQVTERLADGGPNPYVKVRIADFDRGLYSSTATLTLSLSDEYLATLEELIAASDPTTPEAVERQESADAVIAALSDGLHIDIDFTHGPLSVRDGLFFGLSQVTARIDSSTPFLADLQEGLGLPYLMEMRAQLGFDGSTNFQGDIPPISRSENGESFDFSGLDVDGQFNAADRSIRAQARIDSLAGATDEANFSVEGISLTTDAVMVNDYFWLGDSNFLVRHFEVTSANDPGSPMVNLEDAGIYATAALNDAGDRASIDLAYTIGLLNFSDETTLEGAQFHFGLSGIDMRALEKYAELVQNIGLVDAQAMLQSMPELMDILYDVLAGSPSLTIDPVAFKLNGEAFNAKLRIDVDGSALPPRQKLASADPMVWAQVLSGNARLETTESLVNLIAENIVLGQIRSNLPPDYEVEDEQVRAMAKQQSQMLLASFIQQGMFEQEAGRITTAIDYTNGQLSVNGNAIPLGLPAPGQTP